MPASSSEIGQALRDAITRNVRDALAEDVGDGDLTARLVDAEAIAGASVIAREGAVIAGAPWVDEVFAQIDPDIIVDWYVGDGQRADAGDVVCKLVGKARALLTGERSALNFLQTLSATATETARYVERIRDTGARLLDTRKTLPGLRQAQKYSVRMGGGENHRSGLYDAILIKENHVTSAGSIAAALAAAQAVADERTADGQILIEIEVESIAELEEALDSGAERVLLDNFSLDELREAVALAARPARRHTQLEASGNITLDSIRGVAETGVDFISTGAITKNVRAVDLSMLFRID
jgi:nicotinate-nucleotide pyrophosphorylase (carboxylating)